jgi:hypothetical protein
MISTKYEPSQDVKLSQTEEKVYCISLTGYNRLKDDRQVSVGLYNLYALTRLRF